MELIFLNDLVTYFLFNLIYLRNKKGKEVSHQYGTIAIVQARFREFLDLEGQCMF